MPAEVDVAVIGAGLAGISAALEAQQLGARVVVLEAQATPGGKAQTHDGLEHGPQSFNGRYEVIWRLLDALGLRDEAVKLEGNTRYLARGGRLHALKPSPLALLTTGALTLREKLSVMREGMRRREVGPGSSLREFFCDAFGASFADGPAAAMISGIFASDPSQLSAGACFPDLVASSVREGSVLRGMMKLPKTGRRGIFTLRGGMGRIGEAALAKLPIELSTPVRDIKRETAGYALNGEWRAKSLVVATEAPAAAKLLWPVAPELGAALGKLEYASLTVVHWAGTGMPSGFGYLACPSENLFALGTLFHERSYSTFVRGVDATDEQLLQGISGDVQRLTGGRVERLLRVERHAHAVYQPKGPAVEMDGGDIVLAGSYLGSAAMKDAIASGLAAGRRAREISLSPERGEGRGEGPSQRKPPPTAETSKGALP